MQTITVHIPRKSERLCTALAQKVSESNASPGFNSGPIKGKSCNAGCSLIAASLS